MKQISIGNLVFSKVLCGSNPFYGHSHFSEARSAEYLARFDDETIAQAIRRCMERGVNAVESPVNPRILAILARLRAENPQPLRFVGIWGLRPTRRLTSR